MSMSQRPDQRLCTQPHLSLGAPQRQGPGFFHHCPPAPSTVPQQVQKKKKKNSLELNSYNDKIIITLIILLLIGYKMELICHLTREV